MDRRDADVTGPGARHRVSEALVAQVLNNARRSAFEVAAEPFGNPRLLAHNPGPGFLVQHQQGAMVRQAQHAAQQQLNAHNQQVFAAAAFQRAQLNGAAALRDIALCDPLRDPQLCDQLLEAQQLRDVRLLDAQFIENQLRDAQYRQHFSQLQDSQPVMVYIPPSVENMVDTTNRVMQPRGPPEVLDLTIDDDDDDNNNNNQQQIPPPMARIEKHQSTGNFERERKKPRVEQPKETARVISSKTRALFQDRNDGQSETPRVPHGSPVVDGSNHHRQNDDNNGSNNNDNNLDANPATSWKSKAPGPSTVDTRATRSPKSPPAAPPPAAPNTRVLTDDEINTLVTQLVFKTNPTPNKEPDILSRPLTVTPTQLRQIVSAIENSATQRLLSSNRKKDKIISKQNELIEYLKKKTSELSQGGNKDKKKYVAEIEDIRRQSERAMRAYIKAAVFAFEQLHDEQETDDAEDEYGDDGCSAC